MLLYNHAKCQIQSVMILYVIAISNKKGWYTEGKKNKIHHTNSRHSTASLLSLNHEGEGEGCFKASLLMSVFFHPLMIFSNFKINIGILQYLEAVMLDSPLQSYTKYIVQNNLNRLKQSVEYKNAKKRGRGVTTSRIQHFSMLL